MANCFTNLKLLLLILITLLNYISSTIPVIGIVANPDPIETDTAEESWVNYQ